MQPKFSILLLCWNHTDYLEQCIQSLQAQTDQNFEIIFLDNASQDGSWILGTALLKKSKLAYRAICNKEPKGVAYNLNTLRRLASGTFICPLSTDDWYDAEYLERMFEAIERTPGAAVYYPFGYRYFQDGGDIEQVDTSTFRSGYILPELLASKNPLFFVGCCYPATALHKVDGWDDTLQIEDLDLFIRLARHSSFQFVPTAKVYYRISGSTSSANLDWMIRGWEEYYRKYKYIEEYDMRKWLAEKYRAYAAAWMDRDNPEKAIGLMSKAFKLKPLRGSNYRTAFYILRRLITRRKSSNK